ncbi:unnamed protein product [Microthlaspi erraticum]|uniref:Uncharacterized protein n=1 Tax=Microthlaspi erraticum TaxID=1685480 RepID=A0A6D2I1N1_9BRAS|nr:unnamed protein product [Microthlaspi erraticum]
MSAYKKTLVLDNNGYPVDDHFDSHPRSNIFLEQIEDFQKGYGMVIRAPKKRESVERVRPGSCGSEDRFASTHSELSPSSNSFEGSTDVLKGYSVQTGSFYVTPRTNGKVLEGMPARNDDGEKTAFFFSIDRTSV